jgi:hypothetical protein
MEDNIVLDVPSTEEKAQHYTAMGHSVDLINEMRTNAPENMTDEEVADTISRNVEHLRNHGSKRMVG